MKKDIDGIRQKGANPDSRLGAGVSRVSHPPAATERTREFSKGWEETLVPGVLLEGTIDGIPDIIGVQDADHRVLFYNNAGYEFLGTTHEQVKGKRCFELIGRSSPCVPCATSMTYASKRPERIEKHMEEAGIWLDVRSYPLLDERGEIVNVVEHIRDITEIKKAEADKLALERQVMQAQKLESLGVLAGGIAHDFNNLLMVILGNTEMALDGLSPLSPARHNLEEIARAAKRAAELSTQMLAYSGKGRFVNHAIAPAELVMEMRHLLEASVPKNVKLRLDISGDVQSFNGDPSQVRQVIKNLVTNAAEAIGDEPGRITLTAGAVDCDRGCLDSLAEAIAGAPYEALREGRYVFFEVTDTGCGMSDETIAKIFDPFFTTKFPGRGLGLSSVLGIMRGHKGTLDVRSREKEGSTLRVLFPSEAVPEKNGEALGPGARPTRWMGRGKVLLVDDEEALRIVGERMLSRMGFDVLVAEDGREAVEIVRGSPEEVDCVILDLMMPRMNGEDTFRELRAIRPDLKIFLCSGYSGREATRRFAGKGLTGFLQKPFTMTVMREVLSTVMPSANDEG